MADADFEMFVPLVNKAEARSGVLLKAEEVLWLISESHGLNFGWGCQEGGKIGTTPRIDQGNTFGISVRQEVISNAPAEHPKGVSTALFALNPKIEQKTGGDERHEDQCAFLLHRSGIVVRKLAVFKRFWYLCWQTVEKKKLILSMLQKSFSINASGKRQANSRP